MNHYTRPGVVKALAAQVVAAEVSAGKRVIRSPREFRDAVVAAAHKAWMEAQQ